MGAGPHGKVDWHVAQLPVEPLGGHCRKGSRSGAGRRGSTGVKGGEGRGRSAARKGRGLRKEGPPAETPVNTSSLCSMAAWAQGGQTAMAV